MDWPRAKQEQSKDQWEADYVLPELRGQPEKGEIANYKRG